MHLFFGYVDTYFKGDHPELEIGVLVLKRYSIYIYAISAMQRALIKDNGGYLGSTSFDAMFDQTFYDLFTSKPILNQFPPWLVTVLCLQLKAPKGPYIQNNGHQHRIQQIFSDLSQGETTFVPDCFPTNQTHPRTQRFILTVKNLFREEKILPFQRRTLLDGEAKLF